MEIKDELKYLHEWRLSELQSIEDTFNDKFADIMQKLKSKAEKKPVVPWVGAMCQNTYSNSKFWWDDTCKVTEYTEIIDSPLHPQFMPNDGVNPWPADMEVQTIYENGKVFTAKSNSLEWSIDSYILERLRIIGSRPACGWAEYLKERDNEGS